MKLITIRTQILSVVERWKNQYPEDIKLSLAINDNKSSQEILKELKKLDLDITTAEDLKEIIGTDSWACSQRCTECGKYYHMVIEMGELPDYESSTVDLCKNCIQKALKLLTE